MSDIEHARAVRRRRSQILRRLRNGDRSLRKTLERPPKALLGMTVYDLIVASHNMGPAGASTTLFKVSVPPMTPVGHLDPYTLRKIIQHLPKRAT